MSKGQGFFGHQALAEQLARRLRTHFADQGADTSLVIGIFGEWGSGKSNLLQLIGEDFGKATQARQDSPAEDESPPVLVVAFNPWRYEKEEHLFVPLLKTMQFSIDQHASQYESLWEKLGLADKLQRGATLLAVSALAFAMMFKGKFGLPGVGDIELDPTKALDTILKTIDAMGSKPEEPSSLARLESHYYAFEQQLRGFVSDDKPVRLLFLIDDLDRCLPEKAVEMLESIKLFLDVEGCAFVLALDDEVVERGIVHRYRDYIFQGVRLEEKNLAQLPITGPEYLEKIIHLPFRLPQPSRTEIRSFLRARYPQLFDAKPVDIGESLGDAPKASGRMGGWAEPRQAEDLLNLFVSHIPPVPRKHIRSAEVLSLLLGMAKARQCEQQIKLLPLAKLALLQLFAPELYRFGRRHFVGFMRTLQEWSGDAHWGREDFAKDLQQRINTPADGAEALSASQQAEVRNFERFYAPLIHALEIAAHNRSGFDPFLFIKSMPLPSEDMRDLGVYFSFVDEAGRLAEMSVDAAADVPVAELANVDAFLDLLFSSSVGSWQSAVQMPELQGRVLDDATFGRVLQRLQTPDFQTQMANPEWLEWLLPKLSTGQFKQLAELAGQFSAILPGKLSVPANDEDAQAVFSGRGWLAVLRPDQHAVLAGPVADFRAWLLSIVESRKLAVATRAEAGRLLGELGDPRPGVTAQKDAEGRPILFIIGGKQIKLPDIAWEQIKGGTFMMGTEGKAEYDPEKPAHSVTVGDFRMSRYPVTNAQFACFFDAGGYQDERYWLQPPAALAWWLANPGEADLSLLDDNVNWKKSYADWLAQEKTRRQPWFWEQRKWRNPNHPVVGISWYEALAFCNWLNASGQYSGTVRLPTEAEWEYAARGPSGLKYAWGDKADPGLGSYSDTNLERTSAVGMFACGKAFDEQGVALYDMSGNVWEWTSSQWGQRVNAPDFTYAQWDKREAQRDDLTVNALRVIRGGSWHADAGRVRCAYRNWLPPGNRHDVLGLRLVVGVLPGAS